MSRPIVLLTDFGHRDPFVGIMKCVIAELAPDARVIDLTHEIERQNVRAGAHAIASALPFLPRGAIVVGVVDPGVGTERRAIVLETESHTFVGPDNGLFTFVEGAKSVVELREERYFLRSVSNTFHGRDVFAPVAAHLARGVPVERLGPRLRRFEKLEIHRAVRARGVIRGEVTVIDVYGNAITNIPNEWLSQPMTARVGRRAIPLARTYGEVDEGSFVAVPSSGGTLELAINGGDAARALKLRVGSKIEVRA